jgi:hypothetical protein
MQAQQTIPVTEGTTLSGRAVSLPRDLPAGLSVLVMGFNQKSGDACKEWSKQFSAQPLAGQNISSFQMPMLASAPRFIRGMIVRSMKKDTPANLQDRFLPVFDHEQEWKQIASYSTPDDAYLLLVNQQGTVRWQTHGPPTPERIAALQHELAR